jgi:myo-inositol-1(or 4)-monophosphatase
VLGCCPNDGTSDFLKGLKGSAISVGLLYKQIPVLGVVYTPVTKEDIPDYIVWAEGLSNLLRYGEPLITKLTGAQLSSRTRVMVSSAAMNQPNINRELCSPGCFVAMPAIAYRLAKVAAEDGVCAVSLCAVYAHDVVTGHALLRGTGGVLLDEHGRSIRYITESTMMTVSLRCFGGSETACRELVVRDWSRIFAVEK